MPKRIGIPSLPYARQWSDRLKKRVGHAFELVEGAPSVLSHALRQASLDGAFLSPIDYGRAYTHLVLLPEAGAVSHGASGLVLLFFHEKTRTIASICADPGYPSEIVLAHLVMVEKYGIAPTIVPFAGPWEEALTKADAVLAAGEEALTHAGQTNRLDLADEWKDITELPYVHGVWAVREGALSESELVLLADGARHTEPHRQGNQEAGALKAFKYSLDEQAVLGLTEYYRMAYYHGILKDIPEMRFVEFPPKN